MNYHYYESPEGEIIRIASYWTPSVKRIPKCGTWVIEVKDDKGNYVMPAFPEITWGTLSKFKHIG